MPDGSTDIDFGPQAPAYKENNWVQNFELLFRLYAPTKALFDKTWSLPYLEKQT